MSLGLDKAEELLFRKYDTGTIEEASSIFVLGSPRTGSTLLYQLLLNLFDVYYFTNFVNEHFMKHPIVGAAIDSHVNARGNVPYKSEYGKTKGEQGPSEGSFIFREWFGGEHPSQERSARILEGRQKHFLRTFRSIFTLLQKPILTKNAWNCFRVEELTRLLPNARFIWIRRDILQSSLSDLEARYRRGSPQEIWNSATPSNVEALKRQPYWEQVVEIQFEYNIAIEESLSAYASGRYLQVWYEDLCLNTKQELGRMESFLKPLNVRSRSQDRLPVLEPSQGSKGLDEDRLKIEKYSKGREGNRFQNFMYEGRSNSSVGGE